MRAPEADFVSAESVTSSRPDPVRNRISVVSQSRSSAPTDESLVRGMWEGDEEALGLLYDRWSDEVYSVALRVVRDEQEGEEIVEDTFWQAWRQAERFDSSRGTVGGWLLTIARSRALDRYRSRERARPMGGHLTAGDIDSLVAGPGTLEIEQTERREIILGALQKLPEEQREVVEMAYYRGLSQSEIAEGTGQPLGTVKARTRLALEKLRKHLFMLRTYE